MVTPVVGSGPIVLLQLYGVISLKNIKTHYDSYINAQNSAQMYQCIMSSLSETRKKIIANENEKYTTRNIKSRPLLYKISTSKAIIDNRSTANHLRDLFDFHLF